MLDYSYNTVVKNDFWLSWNENNFYFLDLLWRNIFKIYLLSQIFGLLSFSNLYIILNSKMIWKSKKDTLQLKHLN